MKTAFSVLGFISIMMATALGTEPKPIILFETDGIEVRFRTGDGFGVMLLNDGLREGKSIPRYILAIEKSRTVIDTTDLKVFRSVLGLIPKGAVVFSYSVCGLPTFGLDEDADRRFLKAFQELDLKTPPETRITCRCGVCLHKPGWPGNAVANNPEPQK